ncbi:DUF503 domain-containing protein [Planctomycetales bacterium ZRK34]|nr:DUF503 domain-containing protein [Planctomycetales bacterium ZRK34]
MVIGILQVELVIGDAMSLKDKRRVLRSVKDRLGRIGQIAIAEVDEHETHRRAVLGIVTVSTTVPRAQSTLSKILDRLRENRLFVLNDHQMEILTGH